MTRPAHVMEPDRRDGPSLFTGIQLEVDEITLCRTKINAGCIALRAAMVARHESGVKQAADEIAKISGQMQTMAAHVASVLARHQARKPRA